MQTPLRKRPVQERSRKRFEGILDAAAALFAEAGVDATTIDAIAERAGTSVGSLYQYFPDKKAIFFALSERVVERSRAIFDRLMPSDQAERPEWRALISDVVDGFAMLLRDPSARVVWTNLQLFGDVTEADLALHEELIERTAEILAWYAPARKKADRRRIATMSVDVVGGVLNFSAYRDAKRAQHMIAETKILLERYLAPYLD